MNCACLLGFHQWAFVGENALACQKCDKPINANFPPLRQLRYQGFEVLTTKEFEESQIVPECCLPSQCWGACSVCSNEDNRKPYTVRTTRIVTTIRKHSGVLRLSTHVG